MKKIILLTLLTIIVLTFCGCDEEPYEELAGEVYQKEIKPEETIEEKNENNGKTYKYAYPERYVVYVKYDVGAGQTKLEAFYVSKSIYDATNIGDEYYFNEEKDLLEPKYNSKEEVK